MTHRNRSCWWFLALPGLALLISCGCQSTAPRFSASLPNLNPFRNTKPEVEFQQPVRMAVIWKESTVTAPGQKPTRGFGGRVYFYNEDNETVRVDGELTVYAFDDTDDRELESRSPDRKYVFLAQDMQKHYGQTGLGDSYNIWLPWDQVGGQRKTISLVPIFKPLDGMIPKSDHSIAILSGTASEAEESFAAEAGAEDSLVRQVAVTIPPNESPNQASRVGITTDDSVMTEGRSLANRSVRTTTFEVPRSTAARMKLAPFTPPQPRMAAGRRDTSSQVEAASTVLTREASTETENVPTGGNRSRTHRQKSAVFGQPGSFR